jgi:hypothetical protein
MDAMAIPTAATSSTPKDFEEKALLRRREL